MAFGLPNDLVVRVQPDPGGARVDSRAIGRTPMPDLGANCGRIERLIGLCAARFDLRQSADSKLSHSGWAKRRSPMSQFQQIYLDGVVAAFSLFIVMLAGTSIWSRMKGRPLPGSSRQDFA